MSKAFDPYHKWLAIPPRDQPPNHYRLLGIDLFEPDPDVISNAADMRMTLVRSFQSGKHSEFSQKLLNQISGARVCLLDARQRQEYDGELRATLPAPVKPPKAPPPKTPPPKASPSPEAPSPWRQSIEPQPVGQEAVAQKDTPPPEFEPDWTERAQRHEDPQWYRALTGGIAASLGAICQGTIALPRKADHFLRTIAGEDNRILLNFLRAIPLLILLAAAGVAGTLIWINSRDSRVANSHSNERQPDSNGTWKADPVPDGVPKYFQNSIGMELKLVGPGEFMMGAATGEKGADKDETPRHRVRITKPFYIGIYEVTQAEYEEVMGVNPSQFALVPGADTRRFPVDTVSWSDAMEFCRKLSSLPEERKANRKYRLPTEAQWEYACRAGTDTMFGVGKNLSDSNAHIEARDPDRRRRGTIAVGSFKPNSWLLYDMHGNLWEWCADWYDAEYYRRAPRSDPKGPSSGKERVVRGGSWRTNATQCRSANRMRGEPDFSIYTHGFRVVCSP